MEMEEYLLKGWYLSYYAKIFHTKITKEQRARRGKGIYVYYLIVELQA